MLEDGIYGLYFTAARACACKSESSQALAVLRDGKVLGSDPWGGVFAGSCEFDPTDRANKVRLQFGVPPEGMLVTGSPPDQPGPCSRSPVRCSTRVRR